MSKGVVIIVACGKDIPIAETFDIALNSSMLGFLSICQTRPHFARKPLSFSPTAMDS
jgi:hypothetical protein